MIYKIQKNKDGGFEVAATRSRKPVLIMILILFSILGCYGLPYVILWGTVVFGFRHITKLITENTLRAYYAALKEPITCYQFHENDNTVLKRSQLHKQWLEKSQNALYAKGLIGVQEVYFKEDNVLETWTAYLLRVENVRNQANQHFLEDVKHDWDWCKEYLFKQKMD